ncbi:pentaxin domain-containing protein [Catenovulum agarivorans DS-2]|uniref:Pentaxin domain-containing protein n=1 Tax=Catenovulum agarivorans DS-2 TaxID=1328313 RepID=W7QYN8_9ALTE|nr:LamG-like jellyroll fold domain-containing protein [Catenovulum agarivorans]EWH10500.1 pentaxin domain-containing protein [Catenovulum agarivorans DS-2]
MNRTDEFSDIRDIADSVCNQSATPEQMAKLDVLLKGNPQAQRFYQEYIELHVQMSSEVVPNFEVVRRRMMVDEVIVRPTNSGAQPPLENSPASTNQPTAFNQSSSSKSDNSIWPIIIAALIIIPLSVVVLLQFLKNDNYNNAPAHILSGQLQINGLGKIENGHLAPGDYQNIQATQVKLLSGDILHFAEQSSFKLYNATEIELKAGSVVIEANSKNNIIVLADGFTIHSNGDNVEIDLANYQPTIQAQGRAVLIPKRWRPKHYWSFDGSNDRAIDFSGDATGIVSKGAKRIKGLVGAGAFEFDNSKDARINVGSGGGTVPASGSFAVTDGVTIEALIIPEYSGEGPKNGRFGEMDEIFRKDQTDKDHRMLLSFQNDHGKTNLRPAGEFDESLSFGLYILGQGYHELKLPLDGVDGRPTLAQLKDGKMHHVVATYDVKSGLKAIYLDGKMLASYQYPAGSKMLSGGSGLANIGNSPNQPNSAKEAYAGVIDEVAFYDFALPAKRVYQHYQNTKKGRNYFGLTPSAQPLPETIQIRLLSEQIIKLDPSTGLPVD